MSCHGNLCICVLLFVLPLWRQTMLRSNAGFWLRCSRRRYRSAASFFMTWRGGARRNNERAVSTSRASSNSITIYRQSRKAEIHEHQPDYNQWEAVDAAVMISSLNKRLLIVSEMTCSNRSIIFD